jgi:alpha-L-fucosidase
MPIECQAVSRDIVGELTDAVREKGMRMGLYYSGGLDWTFNKTPILELENFQERSTPHAVEYAMVADGHMRELIDLYEPSILWGDIYYPRKGDIVGIVADYYNLIPDGVINNRWGYEGLSDFTTPEYRELDEIHPEKWESCRGLGYSFGYNQFEDESHTLSSADLIKLLVDVVSKNGNLLINVGPRPDGTIPEIQKDRLEELGAWMEINGDAIYDTRPWKISSSTTPSGIDLRYTEKNGKLYIHFFSKPSDREAIPDLLLKKGSVVKLMGEEKPLKWKQGDDHAEVRFPSDNQGRHVHVMEVSPVPELSNPSK